ncbi:alpha/beta hydrolase family protein [Paenibacillus humicola]|uniref:alpha/beta hydrolase family protein n=1 Tax=Paenibacillus humicola TaxID=3110540 RepID=UPI00237B4A30|nr:alpha/beta hydrolase [Paenibacillus humicola]
MEINGLPLRSRPSFLSWLRERLRVMFERDTPFWRAAAAGDCIVCAAMLAVDGFGVPTGFGPMFDSLMMLLLGAAALAVSVYTAAFLLALMFAPVSGTFAGAVLCTGFVVYTSFYYSDAGMAVSAAIAAVLATGGALAGMFAFLLASRSVHAAVKLAAVLLLVTGAAAVRQNQVRDRAAAVSAFAAGEKAAAAEAAKSVRPLTAADPSLPGAYRYDVFTYGSGEDKRRSQFGSGADVRTETVDASAYIKRWPWLRTLYWGFGPKALPLNGRVWMPQGDGPFPLVLILHGNHLMEQPSDEGYAYLGELLASRGFAVVSVDENFLNYSVWTDIPDHDMRARAWLLLQHLKQIAALAARPGNPFYGRVDMHNVALIGHSRGGQAVAMAADSGKWFASDKTLEGLADRVRIQAVAAIAPTDNVVEDESAELKDTYYLTLQGAGDGDVDTFNGERQYIRTTFDRAAGDRFKAAVYIGEANHSRFNTGWGVKDDSLPGGLLLNGAGLMPAGDQRQVAKVYISAFLETALHGSPRYTGLFRDYRSGAAWLPDASYISRYEDGRFRPVARFENGSGGTVLGPGVEASASPGIRWSEQNVVDRDGKSKGSRGAVLQWSYAAGGTWSLALTRPLPAAPADRRAPSLAFSMTNLEGEKIAGEDGDFELPLPDVEIELESAGGASASLPLAEFMPVVRPPQTTFTISPWLEKRIKDGKYKEASEPVLQTYLLPLERFREANPRFDPGRITRITFRFSGEPGKLMFDDIGFET